MAAWGKLTEQERGWVRTAARATETYMIKQGDVTLAREDAELDKLGMKVLQFSPEKAAMLKSPWNGSLWEVADQCCGDGSKELRELARKANLTN